MNKVFLRIIWIIIFFLEFESIGQTRNSINPVSRCPFLFKDFENMVIVNFPLKKSYKIEIGGAEIISIDYEQGVLVVNPNNVNVILRIKNGNILLKEQYFGVMLVPKPIVTFYKDPLNARYCKGDNDTVIFNHFNYNKLILSPEAVYSNYVYPHNLYSIKKNSIELFDKAGNSLLKHENSGDSLQNFEISDLKKAAYIKIKVRAARIFKDHEMEPRIFYFTVFIRYAEVPKSDDSNSEKVYRKI